MSLELNLDFTNVEEAKGSGNSLVRPGTIDTFKVEEAAVETVSDKPALKVKFTGKAGTLNETFWLQGSDAEKTAKMLGRVKHLIHVFTGQEITGAVDSVTFTRYINQTVGKTAYLRVSGKINSDKGVVYPVLPFAKFAGNTAEELSWNSKEQADIANYQDIFDNYKKEPKTEENPFTSTTEEAGF